MALHHDAAPSFPPCPFLIFNAIRKGCSPQRNAQATVHLTTRSLVDNASSGNHGSLGSRRRGCLTAQGVQHVQHTLALRLLQHSWTHSRQACRPQHDALAADIA